MRISRKKGKELNLEEKVIDKIFEGKKGREIVEEIYKELKIEISRTYISNRRKQIKETDILNYNEEKIKEDINRGLDLDEISKKYNVKRPEILIYLNNKNIKIDKRLNIESKEKLLKLLDSGKTIKSITKEYKILKEEILDIYNKERIRDNKYIEDRKEEIEKFLKDGKKYSDICKELRINRNKLNIFCRENKLNIYTNNKIKIIREKLDFKKIEELLRKGKNRKEVYKELNLEEKGISYRYFREKICEIKIEELKQNKRVDELLNKEEIEEKLKKKETLTDLSIEYQLSTRTLSKYIKRNKIKIE